MTLFFFSTKRTLSRFLALDYFAAAARTLKTKASHFSFDFTTPLSSQTPEATSTPFGRNTMTASEQFSGVNPPAKIHPFLEHPLGTFKFSHSNFSPDPALTPSINT
jgi:hypothetical protein